MNESVIFSRLMDEYGNLEQEKRSRPVAVNDITVPESENQKKVDINLMTVEERETGAVNWSVYSKYLRFAGGLFWAPVLLTLLTLAQAAQGQFAARSFFASIYLLHAKVGNNLFLGFWTQESIKGFTQGEYMVVYAALGVASAMFSFLLSVAFS